MLVLLIFKERSDLNMAQKNLKTYLSLVLCTTFWGGAFVAAKVVVQELSPALAASIRFILATIVLIPVLLWKEGKNALVNVKELPILAAAGFTGIFLYNLFFFKGLLLTSAINGSLLVAAGPTITAVLAWVLIKEPLRKNQVIGLAISFAGVLTIISKGSLAALQTLTFNTGDIYIFLGVISWSLYTIVGKIATKRRSSLLTTTYACGLGGLFLSFFALPDFKSGTIGHLRPVTVFSLLFLAVCATAIAFILWYDGINKIGANRVSTFQNIVPLSSALLSIVFLGEKLHLYHGFGALGILLGVYIANNKATSEAQISSSGQPKIINSQ
jgi:drug/metabolite transporter (DMT)-like permease